MILPDEREPAFVDEIMKLYVVENETFNFHFSTGIRHVAEAVDIPRTTVQNFMRSILEYYP